MGQMHSQAEREPHGQDGGVVSRRVAVGSCGLAFLGILGGGVLAQAQEQAPEGAGQDALEMARRRARQAAQAKFDEEQQKRDPRDRAFFEQIQNATTVEARKKVMLDWQLKQTLEGLKKELGVPPEEWSVIEPRIVAIYRLMHADALPAEEKGALALVTQRTKELWELLGNRAAKPEEIKERLTGLRAAKEQLRQELIKARLELSKIMTLRQEAWLVLSGLLE